MSAMDDRWRKSNRSGDNGACVETRYADGTAQVRDSKDVDGPVLTFDPAQWTTFITSLKRGTFQR